MPNNLDFTADAEAHGHEPVECHIRMFNVTHDAAGPGGEFVEVLGWGRAHAFRFCWNRSIHWVKRRPVRWLSKCSILQLSISA